MNKGALPMEQKKVGFASGIGFILAAAGSAIGLGNLWAFPYKTSANGGAAFVILYIASVLFIGLIVTMCETFIGKRAQANPISAYKKVHKNAGWFGMLAIALPTIIICYYSVLGGYTVKFTLNSFVGNAGVFNSFAGNIGDVLMYTAIFIILSLMIVLAGVKNGIEKASKVLMPALFLILTGIVVFSLFLGEGVKDGLEFYLKPDFSELTWTSVLAAMSQAFFSLSLGMGIMITYGSYSGKEINLVKSTIMICIFDTVVALLAGLAIFPAVFHYAATAGIPYSELGMGGIGLMFQTLPYVFADMGILGQIVSLLFFAMVTIAAMTSVISLIEVATQFVIQKFHTKRKVAAVAVGSVCFAVAIPVSISLGKVLNGDNSMVIFGQNWLDFLDLMTNTVLMPVGAFLACLAVGWIIGIKKTCNEIEQQGTKLGAFRPVFSIMAKFVTPLLILVVEIFGCFDLIMPMGENGRSFSENGLGIVACSYGLLALCLIVYFIFFRNTETGTNEDEHIVDWEEMVDQSNAAK